MTLTPRGLRVANAVRATARGIVWTVAAALALAAIAAVSTLVQAATGGVS